MLESNVSICTDFPENKFTVNNFSESLSALNKVAILGIGFILCILDSSKETFLYPLHMKIFHKYTSMSIQYLYIWDCVYIGYLQLSCTHINKYSWVYLKRWAYTKRIIYFNYALEGRKVRNSWTNYWIFKLCLIL